MKAAILIQQTVFKHFLFTYQAPGIILMGGTLTYNSYSQKFLAYIPSAAMNNIHMFIYLEKIYINC